MKYLLVLFFSLFLCLNVYAVCGANGNSTCFVDISGVGAGLADGTTYENRCAGINDVDCGATGPMTVYWCNSLTGAGLTLPHAGGSVNAIVTYDNSCPGGMPATITATSGTAGILVNKAWTVTKNATVSYAGSKPIQINASNVWVQDNTITGGQDGITLTTPTQLSNVNITGNTITGLTRYGIQSIYSGASTQSLTDLTISNNTIRDNPNSGIFLQCGVASVACTYVRPTISGNSIIGNGNTGIVFQDCYDGADIVGGCLDVIINDFSDYKDCVVMNNTVIGQTDGGGIAIYGCVPSVAGTHGLNVISGNNSSNNNGVIGGIDLFNSTYVSVFNNTTSNNTTSTIDANGILIDYGNRYTRVYKNTASNNVGKSGVDNSGVGIMCLKCIDVEVWANKGTGNKAGFFFSGASFAETNVNFYNNTFLENIDYGAYFDNTQNASSTILYNNILSGSGTCIYVESGGNVNIENYNQLVCSTRSNFNSVGWSDGSSSITSILNLNNFLLKKESLARRSGKDLNLGNYYDCLGRAFQHPPSIGACEVTSGFEASSRTNATTRAPRQ